MSKTVNSLADIPVILASGSPRRIKMLRDLGIDPVIIRPECGETLHTDLTPAQTVMALSLRKALSVASSLEEGHPADDWLLIASDTVVSFEGRILGKPKNEADAFQMLSAMNGRMNSVYSGACLIRKGRAPELLYDRSDVYFRPYGTQDIIAYVASGEPMDKAGAYAIQENFAPYCERVVGSMNNVIGLPLEKISARVAQGI